MRVADVMTTAVITVRPDQSVQDVAKVLVQHRISGAPVIDQAGRLVGIVSEGDLMRRVETGTDVRRSWWLRVLAHRETLAAEYVRAHARKVKDVMTPKVVTVSPDADMREVASLLERHRIKRVPVMEKGKIVGIVSRANLLQAFASLQIPPDAGGDDDVAVRKQVLDRLSAERWSSPASINVFVQNGVVELWGAVASEVEQRAIRVTAENTPGVVAVNDHLAVAPVTPGI